MITTHLHFFFFNGFAAGRKRYTHVLPNGMRITGDKATIEEAIAQFEAVQPAPRPKKDVKPKIIKQLPDEALALQPDGAPVNTAVPTRPPVVLPVDDDEEAILLLIA